MTGDYGGAGECGIFRQLKAMVCMLLAASWTPLPPSLHPPTDTDIVNDVGPRPKQMCRTARGC